MGGKGLKDSEMNSLDILVFELFGKDGEDKGLQLTKIWTTYQWHSVYQITYKGSHTGVQYICELLKKRLMTSKMGVFRSKHLLRGFW